MQTISDSQLRIKREIRIIDLQKETNRISEVTLRGNFTNPDDREYWVKRLKQLTGELSTLEQLCKPSRKVFTRKLF